MKKNLSFLVLTCVLLILHAAPGPPARAQGGSNLPLRLPGPTVRPRGTDPRIPALKGKIARAHIFAAYRQLAEIYVSLGRYEDAAATLREEAGWYRKKGLFHAAIIEEAKANQWRTDLRLFLERKASPAEVNALYSGAVAEPVVGCYLGVHTESDEEDFARQANRPHGSYFIYRWYGDECPTQWIRQVKARGAIPQIAWEPRSLNTVQDDGYLRRFAKECGALNWPIFIRFASEMNGHWTPWHNNPPLYRQKFRLVHRVLHHYASQVATIWCVNNPPLDNIDNYYPGDGYCDWVGVNLYSVPFHENNLQRPAFAENPLDLVDPIYRKFAARKPIAICEYAASHEAAVDRVRREEFAIEKLTMLYTGLPLLYPRVKLVDWFHVNMLNHPIAGKTTSNYTVLESAAISAGYRAAAQDPWYLGQAQRPGDALPVVPRPLVAGQPVSGWAQFRVWARTYVARPKLYLKLGGRIVYAGQRYGAHTITVNTTVLPPGTTPVTLYLFDDKNRFVTSTSSSVLVARG